VDLLAQMQILAQAVLLVHLLVFGVVMVKAQETAKQVVVVAVQVAQVLGVKLLIGAAEVVLDFK
jgi:hypothetical protein